MLPGRRYRPEDILHIAGHWSWLILASWAVVAAGSFVVARTIPDRYRSDSVIQVVPQRVPENLVKSTITSKIDERLPIITQQILSRTRLERTIQDFGLYAEARKTELMEDVVRMMRRDVVGPTIVKGDAFQISYISTDPKTAMRVTERLASLFVEENLRDREMLTEGANQFLDSQLDDARRRLLDHEKKLEEFRLRHSGELPSQMQANVQAIQNTQLQIQALSESINRDRDQRLVLERALADVEAESAVAPSAGAPGASTAEPVDASPAAQLESARALLAQLETRFTPLHPDVIRLTRTVKDLEQKVAAEGSGRAGGTGADAAKPVSRGEALRQNRLRELRTSIDSLTRQVARKEENARRLQGAASDLQRRVDTTPTRESELTALTRDYDTLQKVYTSLLSRSEEAKVAANLERRQIGEQFRVIDPARLPGKPFSPNRLQIYGIGAIAGLVLGLALVALLEYRDSSLRTTDEVMTTLTLPVLAALPRIVTEADRRSARRIRLVLLGTAALVVLSAAAATLAWKLELLDRWR